MPNFRRTRYWLFASHEFTHPPPWLRISQCKILFENKQNFISSRWRRQIRKHAEPGQRIEIFGNHGRITEGSRKNAFYDGRMHSITTTTGEKSWNSLQTGLSSRRVCKRFLSILLRDYWFCLNKLEYRSKYHICVGGYHPRANSLTVTSREFAAATCMQWKRLVGSLKMQVSVIKRAPQNRPMFCTVDVYFRRPTNCCLLLCVLHLVQEGNGSQRESLMENIWIKIIMSKTSSIFRRLSVAKASKLQVLWGGYD